MKVVLVILLVLVCLIIPGTVRWVIPPGIPVFLVILVEGAFLGWLGKKWFRGSSNRWTSTSVKKSPDPLTNAVLCCAV